MLTEAMKERVQRFGGKWNDTGDGYSSLISRSRLGGYLLAYIALPGSHPDTGTHYDEVRDGPEVNGGLTFSSENVFGWDYGHVYNSHDIDGDIERALTFFRARA